MLLSLSHAGLPFVGADVGGFFGNPDAELMTRWMQLGALYPFFRAHAHLETKRREPWMFDSDTLNRIRDALRLRYSLLPYLYATFWASHTDGGSVWMHLGSDFPHDPTAPTTESQALVGHALMVAPVLVQGATTRDVYLPADAGLPPGPVRRGLLAAWAGRPAGCWYDLLTGHMYAQTGRTATVSAPIDRIPVFLRGGWIIPMRMRPRRSSAAQFNDPLTLVVGPALTPDLQSSPAPIKGPADGFVYLDDTHSFHYQQGVFLLRRVSLRPEGVGASPSVRVSNRPLSTRELLSQYADFTEPLPPAHWPKIISLGYDAPGGITDRDAMLPQTLPLTSMPQAIEDPKEAAEALQHAMTSIFVERIKIYGVESPPRSIHLENSSNPIDFDYNEKTKVLEIQRIDFPISQDWDLIIEF